MGHNLLRIDCVTWVLLQSLWGGGLTSTEQEAAVMGEDNGLEDGKRPLTSEDRPRHQTKFTAGFFKLSHCKPI